MNLNLIYNNHNTVTDITNNLSRLELNESRNSEQINNNGTKNTATELNFMDNKIHNKIYDPNYIRRYVGSHIF